MIALINLELDGIEYIPSAIFRGRALLQETELLVRYSPEPEQAAHLNELKGIILTAEGRGQEAVVVISEALDAMVTNTIRASGLRSRAAALRLLGLHSEALHDLHDAMNLVPEGPDRAEIKMLLEHVERAAAKETC